MLDKFFLCFYGVHFSLVDMSFVVTTSAISCLERLVTEVTYYMLSGMLNSLARYKCQ